MAYSDSIKFVVGDTRPVISIALKDSNTAAAGKTLDSQDSTTWATISLASNDYVKMYIRKVGSTTLAATLTASNINTSNGTADFTPTTSTFSSAGTQVKLDYVNQLGSFDENKFQDRDYVSATVSHAF